MALYLTRFSYTPETWAKLVQHPEDRRAAATQYIEAVGGTLHGFWYAFGEHDGYNLWEAPDNVSMAATAIALSGGGALSSVETTVLLTVGLAWLSVTFLDMGMGGIWGAYIVALPIAIIGNWRAFQRRTERSMPALETDVAPGVLAVQGT